MLIIPAIDIFEGRVARLFQGEKSRVTFYDRDPVEIARWFEKAGARRIHIVDLDGAFRGHPVNTGVVNAIRSAVRCEIQTGGGLRDESHIRDYLNAGIDYVMVSSFAFKAFDRFKKITREFPGKIILSIDTRENTVVTSGWTGDEALTPAMAFRMFSGFPIHAVLHTDVTKDGTLQGVNTERLCRILDMSPFPVIAAGGVASEKDIAILRSMNHPKLMGVVIGKAVYEGKISLEKILEG